MTDADRAAFLSRCGLTAEDLAGVLVGAPCPPELVLGLIRTESGGNPNALRYEPDYQYQFEPVAYAKVHGWTTATEVALGRAPAQITAGAYHTCALDRLGFDLRLFGHAAPVLVLSYPSVTSASP